MFEKRLIATVLIGLLVLSGCENSTQNDETITESHSAQGAPDVGKATEVPASSSKPVQREAQKILGAVEERDAIPDVEPTLEQPKKTDTNKDVREKIAGRFRCWSYNVQGAGKSCSSPPLILNTDGSYSMSSEKGTYTVDGDTLRLSESKIRGPGTILADGYQIRFEYDYNSWHHTLTYSRVEGSETAGETPQRSEGQQFLQVTLKMIFPYDASGVNTAQLREQGQAVAAGEALAYQVGEQDENSLEAVFRKDGTKSGIMSGKVYEVWVSSGFSPWSIGTIDLREVQEDITLTVRAPALDAGS